MPWLRAFLVPLVWSPSSEVAERTIARLPDLRRLLDRTDDLDGALVSEATPDAGNLPWDSTKIVLAKLMIH